MNFDYTSLLGTLAIRNFDRFFTLIQETASLNFVEWDYSYDVCLTC